MRFSTRTLLAVATMLAGGGATAALARQGGGGIYDVTQMPAIHGKVAQYDLTPRGDVDGLILDDGMEAHFPPHLGSQVVAIVRPGDEVTIHGLKARALPLVQAMSVTDDASGKTVVDDGPPAPGRRPPPPPPPAPGMAMQTTGMVKMQLHGPRGELNGVLLTDGTMVHLPPAEAQRLSGELSPGERVVARGDGIDNTLGRVIAANAIGPSSDRMTQITAPPPPPPPGPGGPVAPPPPPA